MKEKKEKELLRRFFVLFMAMNLNFQFYELVLGNKNIVLGDFSMFDPIMIGNLDMLVKMEISLFQDLHKKLLKIGS